MGENKIAKTFDWLYKLLWINLIVGICMSVFELVTHSENSQISTLVDLVYIALIGLILSNLWETNEGYKTTSIMLWLSALIALIGHIMMPGAMKQVVGYAAFLIVELIVNLVAQWKMYKTHSDLFKEKDPELSACWVKIWHYLVIGIVLVFFGTLFVPFAFQLGFLILVIAAGVLVYALTKEFNCLWRARNIEF